MNTFTSKMFSPNTWIRVAGVSGAVAVTLGAIGAHALRDHNDAMRETWKVASAYHFTHTIALALSAFHFTGRKRDVTCGLFALGIALFCGSCYTVVLMNQRQPYATFAPFGGFALIGGWLAFALL